MSSRGKTSSGMACSLRLCCLAFSLEHINNGKLV